MSQTAGSIHSTIAQVHDSLPNDVRRPIVRQLRFNNNIIVACTIGSTRHSMRRLDSLMSHAVDRRVLAIPKITQMSQINNISPRVHISLSPRRLSTLNVATARIGSRVHTLGVGLPDKQTALNNRRRDFHALNDTTAIRRVRSTQVILPGKAAIPLADLKRISLSCNRIQRTTRLDNRPIITFRVCHDANDVLISMRSNIATTISQLQRALPRSIDVRLVFAHTARVHSSCRTSVSSLVVNYVLTMIIIKIFLLS